MRKGTRRGKYNVTQFFDRLTKQIRGGTEKNGFIKSRIVRVPIAGNATKMSAKYAKIRAHTVESNSRAMLFLSMRFAKERIDGFRDAVRARKRKSKSTSRKVTRFSF